MGRTQIARTRGWIGDAFDLTVTIVAQAIRGIIGQPNFC
jgi:hypothetical protein